MLISKTKNSAEKQKIKSLKWMTEYGLHPHLTIMVGYYWETKEMLQRTVDLVKKV